MVDGRGHLRLSNEPSSEFVVRRELGREDLERRLAVQSKVSSQIHDPHPATSDGSFDPILLEGCTDCYVRAQRNHGGSFYHGPPRPGKGFRPIGSWAQASGTRPAL